MSAEHFRGVTARLIGDKVYVDVRDVVELLEAGGLKAKDDGYEALDAGLDSLAATLNTEAVTAFRVAGHFRWIDHAMKRPERGECVGGMRERAVPVLP